MKNDKILLLEQLYMAAHVIDTDGRILWANNFEMSQLGYLPADYVGHKFSEVRRESFPK
jgi:PAS fold